MNLQFDTIAELKEFLALAGFQRGEPVVVIPAGTTRVEVVLPAAGTGGIDADPVAVTDKPSEAATNSADAAAPEEKGTRKRRTKAELEADKLASIAADKAAAEKLATEPAGAAGEPTGEPDNLPPAEKSDDPVAYIAAALALVPEVAQVDHLVKARAFIAKHGMAKYTETQALAGLAANVMAYTKADCAAHVAAMDFVLQS